MELKQEVLQINKINCICCFSQRSTYEVQDAVLRKPLLKNHTFNCLTFEENTRQPCNDSLCPFHFSCGCSAFTMKATTGRRNLKVFNSFIKKRMNWALINSEESTRTLLLLLLTLNILLFDKDIVDGNILGENSRRSVQKHENTVRLLRYNNHIC